MCRSEEVENLLIMLERTGLADFIKLRNFQSDSDPKFCGFPQEMFVASGADSSVFKGTINGQEKAIKIYEIHTLI